LLWRLEQHGHLLRLAALQLKWLKVNVFNAAQTASSTNSYDLSDTEKTWVMYTEGNNPILSIWKVAEGKF
jgi:hypothetical protein